MARVQIDSEIRKLIKLVEDQGWSVTASKGNRLHWIDPEGHRRASSGTRVAANRNYQNLVAELRRNGLQIEREEAKEKAVVVAEPCEVELEVEISPEQALEVLMEFVTAEREQPELETVQSQLEAASLQVQTLMQQRDEARAQVRALQTQVASQAATLHDVTEAFERPSWEVLPEIARICGVRTGA